MPSDLKSPSHYNILNYFKTYYVPNNMAIVMSGDFDPDKVVALAEQNFGAYTSSEIPAFTFKNAEVAKGVKRQEVFGQQSSSVQLAWRLDGASSTDDDYASMLSSILYNQQAGLIDLDLVQQQKVLEASARSMNLADYSAFILSGRPREGC